MRCDEVAVLLPGPRRRGRRVEPRGRVHVQQCLRCQTDLVRYRKLVRNLELLRTRYIEPNPGLLGDTLALLSDVTERNAMRTIVTGRRLAYVGAIGGTVATAHRAADRPVPPPFLGRAAPRQLRRDRARRAVPEGRCYPLGPAPAPGGQ